MTPEKVDYRGMVAEAARLALVGKYAHFDYPDGKGGAGLVVEVDPGPPLCAIVDYGYGFDLVDDVTITITDPPEVP